MNCPQTILNWITFGWCNKWKKRKKPCKVFDIYVDISIETVLHYKHCDVHGYTIPVDLKTTLYKSNIFYHPNISVDDAPTCILHNAEVPGSEKNRVENGRKGITGRKSINDIPAVAIRKFKLAEETRADGSNEVRYESNQATTSSYPSYSRPDEIKRSSTLCFRISRRRSEHDRPASLLLEPRKFTSEPRKRRLTSRSVVFITPDEENPK